MPTDVERRALGLVEELAARYLAGVGDSCEFCKRKGATCSPYSHRPRCLWRRAWHLVHGAERGRNHAE